MIGVRDAFVLALRGLRADPARATLTMASIVLGVASVIVLAGLGVGLRTSVDQNYGRLNTTIVASRSLATTPGANESRSLTEGDYQALRDPAAAPAVIEVIPERTGTAVLRRDGAEFRANIVGTTGGYLHLRLRRVAVGRMFTEQENADRARVVVIGPKIVDALFGGDAGAALDADVRIGRLTMRVVGVLDTIEADRNAVSLLPLNSARALFAGSDALNSIGVVAADRTRVAEADAQLKGVLDRRHRISDPDRRDYAASTAAHELTRIDRYLALINWFTLSVAAIALVIGALGVANMMVVTVTERTGEIGVRRAVGARRSAIVREFLLEALTLAGSAGLVGVVVGISLTVLGGLTLPTIAPGYGSPAVSAPSVAVAFTASLLIGLLAGVHPALRAAGLNPIDALRH
ncbi:ABC transporter permease [Pseudonocardia spinosispora]|uniref:ABC transporter permease n=1 Tax=Pseudonocardia spinosispora TaxID=103441 RepID=UPI00041FA8A3|nr:ABC transporter permease [Pseudonocardia spinosispora]